MYSLAVASSAALPARTVITSLTPMIAGGFAAWNGDSVETASMAVVLACGSILVGWLAGENARARRSHALELAGRAAERERETARSTLIEERARIARELHDVVAHAMSVISVRSGVARRIGAGQPEQAAEALALIETISRQSLSELRRLVTVLREADEPAAAEIEPARGLADLPELAKQVAAAGIDVDVRVEGTQRRLPPAEDLTAYRISQEALTNVVRHAAAGTATLSVRYHGSSVEIECVSPWSGSPPARGPDGHRGHGIISMRERVALYGGEFSAGPAGHAFRVFARLPIAGEPL